MTNESFQFTGQFPSGTKLICVDAKTPRFTAGKIYVVDEERRITGDKGGKHVNTVWTMSRFVLIKEDPDPLAHFWVTERKFVGGYVSGFGFSVFDGGQVYFHEDCCSFTRTPADARLIAAALIAAADAAEGNAC